jgi:4-amino-4-deoxy-L-arabinose transferase-like glycosyltransferase
MISAIEARPRATLIGLLVLAFVVQLVIAMFILRDAKHDPLILAGWGDVALNLLEGNGYATNRSLEMGQPFAGRGPVPVFLFAGIFYLFGKSLWAVMVANWLLGVGTAYLLYRIIFEIFPNPWYVAFPAIALWPFYAPAIALTKWASSEPIFTFLLAGHVWTLLRLRHSPSMWLAASSGLLLGLATLSRPVVQLWLLAVWLLFLLPARFERSIFQFERRKGAVSAALVLTVAFGLTLLPWTIRNYVVFDGPTPLTPGFGGILYINNAVLDKAGPARRIGQSEIPEFVRQETKARGKRYPEDVDLTQLAIEKILANPVRYFEFCGYRFVHLWFGLGPMRHYGVRPPEKPPMQTYMFAIAQGVLLCLMVAGFVYFRGDWIGRSVPVVLLILYTVGVHTLFNAQPRYLIPVMPYVIMFSVYTGVCVLGSFGFLNESKLGIRDS